MEVCKNQGFANLTKGRTPSGKREEYYAKDGLPWVKIENLKRKWVNKSEEFLSGEGEQLGRTVPRGSVLLSVNRTIGKVGIAEIPLQTNEQIIAVTCPESDQIFSEYLYYYFKFSEETLKKRAYVTVNSRISLGMLADMIVPVADAAYQKYCVEMLCQIEELLWKKEDMCELLQRYLAALQKKKDRAILYDTRDEASDLQRLTYLLEQSKQLSQRLFETVLKQIFGEAEKKKADVYYGGKEARWQTIDEVKELDEPIRHLLKEMSFFQQCMYRAFYAAGVPSPIHTVLKQVKKLEPSLGEKHIQDAVAAVETFRQMGLMARQEERKLYYASDQTEENEILREDGSNLMISLWGCSFPEKGMGLTNRKGEDT